MKSLKIGIICLFAILLCTGCGTSPTTKQPTTTIAGCYIGAFVNGIADTPNFETMIGRNLAVNMWYIDWNTSFPSTECDTVNDHGGVPMITWEPSLNTTNTLEAISNGNYNSYITTFAQDAKNWGNLVYLRFAHEMNGNWYPWDGYHNGESSGPARYISAWKHIHDIFTSVEATNVAFVWSPNHISVPNESWNEAVGYYPGDDYVDWIAIDGYNWGNGNWQTFDQIFSAIYATFESYGKNMMVGEFACATDEAENKADWITDAFYEIKDNYPEIKIFNWFNIKKYEASAGKIVDWRVESSSNSENAFKRAVGDSYFIENPPSD